MNFSMHFSHKFNDSCTLQTNSQFNMQQVGNSTKLAGFTGFMNYPFNFGLRLKVDG